MDRTHLAIGDHTSNALCAPSPRAPCTFAPGIGKSLAAKLARQGINVVLVALGDQLLDSTFEELKAEYPKQEFRKVNAPPQ